MKKIVAIILAALFMLLLSSCLQPSPSSTTPDSVLEQENVNTEEENITETSEYSADEIVSILLDATVGNVGEGEKITGMEFAGRTLIVYVDFSNANPEPFSLEDIAESRASSITDTILDYEDFDSYWDIIRIDYGDVGYIEADKTMIVESEYGRYFEFPLNPIVK